MADTKISALPAITTVNLTDEFAVNQGGVSKKVTRQQMLDTERYMLRADATRTLVSQTTRQAIFGSPNTLTLPVGTYRFEMMIYLTGMSATSGNAQLDILGAGNAVASAWLWQATGADNSIPAAAATQTGGTHIVATSGSAGTLVSSTGTGMAVRSEGMFEVTTAGTLIPSILLTTAAAPTLGIGSYLWAERISSSTTLTGLGPTS